MFVCFLGGQNFTSWWPRKKNPCTTKFLPKKKKGGGARGGKKLIIIYPEARLLPPRQGWTNWQTCKGRPRVFVVCPKPSPPLLSKEGRRAEAKEGTNERGKEGGRRSACMRENQTTRRCCCSLLKESTVRIGIAHPESLQKRSVWLIRLSLCLSSALPSTTFADVHYRPTTFGLLPLWEGGRGAGTWELAFFLSFFKSLCVKRLCEST
jgi:hypothetical protein